ncbi:hypothetical protein SRHO_G00076080 [Serrasalmus rhombeus]
MWRCLRTREAETTASDAQPDINKGSSPGYVHVRLWSIMMSIVMLQAFKGPVHPETFTRRVRPSGTGVFSVRTGCRRGRRVTQACSSPPPPRSQMDTSVWNIGRIRSLPGAEDVHRLICFTDNERN